MERKAIKEWVECNAEPDLSTCSLDNENDFFYKEKTVIDLIFVLVRQLTLTSEPLNSRTNETQ